MKKKKQVNKTTYLRSKKGFTAISMEVTSSDLSIGAIGLLTLILSNQDHFVIYKKEIVKRSGVGVTLFNKYWDELINSGFLYAIKRNHGGISYEYIIVNEPSNNSNKDVLEKIIENHTLNLTPEKPLPINQGKKTTTDNQISNIVLNNSAENKIDYINKEDNHSALGMQEILTDDKQSIAYLKNYWYQNIHQKELNNLEEAEILTQELFVKIFRKVVSEIKQKNFFLGKIKNDLQLKSLYYAFNMVVDDLKRSDKSITEENIFERIIPYISAN
jgi:hypothetical protein